jgi:hypothetical protein
VKKTYTYSKWEEDLATIGDLGANLLGYAF